MRVPFIQLNVFKDSKALREYTNNMYDQFLDNPNYDLEMTIDCSKLEVLIKITNKYVVWQPDVQAINMN